MRHLKMFTGIPPDGRSSRQAAGTTTRPTARLSAATVGTFSDSTSSLRAFAGVATVAIKEAWLDSGPCQRWIVTATPTTSVSKRIRTGIRAKFTGRQVARSLRKRQEHHFRITRQMLPRKRRDHRRIRFHLLQMLR